MAAIFIVFGTMQPEIQPISDLVTVLHHMTVMFDSPMSDFSPLLPCRLHSYKTKPSQAHQALLQLENQHIFRGCLPRCEIMYTTAAIARQCYVSYSF